MRFCRTIATTTVSIRTINTCKVIPENQVQYTYVYTNIKWKLQYQEKVVYIKVLVLSLDDVRLKKNQLCTDIHHLSDCDLTT